MIIALFVYLALRGDKWTGFYYPDRDDLSEYTKSQTFGSLSECIAWTDDKSEGNTNAQTECGKGCKYKEQWDIYVCKETI